MKFILLIQKESFFLFPFKNQIFRNNNQMSDEQIKFTEIDQEQQPWESFPPFQEDEVEQVLNNQPNLRNSVDLQQIYQHTQRTILMAQQMLIEPNYSPFISQNESLMQSRKLQADTFNISKGFVAKPPLEKVSLIAQKVKAPPVQSTRPMTPEKSEQRSESFLKVRNSLYQFDKKNQTKRISIFLQSQKQCQKSSIPYKYRGPIPLKDHAGRESLVIKTYRQVKYRIEKSYDKLSDEQFKRKSQAKKQQNNKFKGLLVTYDYNGQLIPLKSTKNNTVHHSPPSVTQAVVITPLSQNIIVPPIGNKPRFQKKKAKQPPEEGELKQNQSHYTGPQLVISEGSQFLRKTPKYIAKSKLFRNQQQNIAKKSPDQLSFSEFKNNTAYLKNLSNCPAQLKNLKSRRQVGFNINIATEENSTRKNLRRIPLNHGKMNTNQKIFEKIFDFKPNCEQNLSQQDIKENEFIGFQKAIRQMETSKVFEDQISLHNLIEKKKENLKQLQAKGVGDLRSISKAIRQGLYKSFGRQDRMSIIRNSLKESPRKSSAFENVYGEFETLKHSSLQKGGKSGNIVHKYGHTLQNMMESSKLIEEENNQNGMRERVRQMQGREKKQKLRFRPSSTVYENY